jgi:hypothetical protein
VRGALAAAKERFGFRLVHFTVQGNHLHLICEAKDRVALTRGMQGLSIRIARRLNRAEGRKGRLFSERYHARILRSPREVRRALVYVLNNSRRHAGRDVTFARDWVEPLSSARWFDGWRWAPRAPVEHEHGKGREQENEDECPVAPAGTWLLATGWRRHGLIAPDEVPGPPGD